MCSSDLPTASTEKPGTVVSAGREGIDVACADGVLRIRTLQREGGRAISAGDYVNARGPQLA